MKSALAAPSVTPLLVEPLFPVTAPEVALTTDEWYTPRWLFAAAALTFDIDVCAPMTPEFRTCPARRYLTVVEDGLTQPWEGAVWCNPPYSRATPWADRWAAHPDGLFLAPAMREVRWIGRVMAAADAFTLLSMDFARPDGTESRVMWMLTLAARGAECVGALARIAAADRYTRGAYHVRPAG